MSLKFELQCDFREVLSVQISSTFLPFFLYSLIFLTNFVFFISGAYFFSRVIPSSSFLLVPWPGWNHASPRPLPASSLLINFDYFPSRWKIFSPQKWGKGFRKKNRENIWGAGARVCVRACACVHVCAVDGAPWFKSGLSQAGIRASVPHFQSQIYDRCLPHPGLPLALMWKYSRWEINS